MRISEMKINNKLIDEVKLNGQIVYRLDRDRTPPKVLYTKIQLYYPLVYPSNTLYPSKNLYPRSSRDLHHAYIGDTIYIEFQVDEELKTNPTIKLGNKEFSSNLLNNNIYNAYIILADDLNLPNNSKIQITISNLIDISNNKADDYVTQGSDEDYVILDNNFVLNYTDKDNISHSEIISSEELLKNRIQELKTVQEGNIVYQNLKTCKIISNGIKIKDCSRLFSKCEGLTSVDLSELDTSEATDMSAMFTSCNGLVTLDLSTLNTSNVTDMGAMFSYCQNLTELDLSNFDTSNVTNMTRMFYYCDDLTTLKLAKFNTSNVTAMNSMFYSCSNLTSLDLSSFNTSNIINMSAMFSNCYDLVTLDLSNFDTSNVTNMNSMFTYCTSLNTLDLSNFDFSNVSGTTSMFYEVPSDCLITVKDQTSKNFILNIRNDFTNIQIKEE